MKHAATLTLFAYWNRLRAGRAAPERADIDPAAIRGILADTFVVEIEDHGPDRRPGLTTRLSGTRVNALFDADQKGQSLWSWWRTDDVPLIEVVIGAVLQDTRPAVIGLRASADSAHPITLELLLLPLKHHGKTQTRMLGVLSPASVPSWLGLMRVGPMTVTSHRMLEVNDVPLRKNTPLRSPEDRRTPPQKRGHLTVYEGDRGSLCDRSGLSLSPH